MEPFVLIVDDDSLVLSTIAGVLDTLHFNVVTAASGKDALDILAGDTPIDVLLTDLMMTQMTGIELADRAVRLRPSLRIVLTSGYPATLLDNIPSRYSFIAKPFAADALNSLLRRSIA